MQPREREIRRVSGIHTHIRRDTHTKGPRQNARECREKMSRERVLSDFAQILSFVDDIFFPIYPLLSFHFEKANLSAVFCSLQFLLFSLFKKMQGCCISLPSIFPPPHNDGLDGRFLEKTFTMQTRDIGAGMESDNCSRFLRQLQLGVMSFRVNFSPS